MKVLSKSTKKFLLVSLLCSFMLLYFTALVAAEDYKYFKIPKPLWCNDLQLFGMNESGTVVGSVGFNINFFRTINI